MEPEHGFDDHVNQCEQAVPPVDMAQLVRQHGFQLRRRQAFRNARGQKQNGPEDSDHARSSRPGEERTATGAGMSMGALARIAARMRSQPRNRISATLANPQAHTPRIAMRTQSRVPRGDGAGGKAPGNGWLMGIIVNETARAAICVATFWAAGVHCRWLPRVMSRANGMRNLSDALNHSQWRT